MQCKIRMIPWLFAAGLALGTMTTWADGARIAVAAEGEEAAARVSAVAARSPFLLIFHADGALLESHPNPVADKRSGAGPAMAAWLADRKIGTLIAGDFGSKLATALEARGINRVTASGPADEAAKKVVP